MNYARIDGNGLVLEVIQGDPAKQFHPDLAKAFQPVPAEVKAGWVKSGSNFTAPAPTPEPEIPEPPKQPLPKSEFLAFLTRAERTALRGARDTDPVADDFLLMLDETGVVDLTSDDGEAALAHFVAQGYITAARAAEAKALVD